MVIATCVDSRSSQSMGDLLAQPSAAPVPFQLDQSVAVTGNRLQPHRSAAEPAANWTLVVVAVVVVFSVVVLRSSGMGGWRTKIDHTPTLRRFRIRRPGVVAPVSGEGGGHVLEESHVEKVAPRSHSASVAHGASEERVHSRHNDGAKVHLVNGWARRHLRLRGADGDGGGK